MINKRDYRRFYRNSVTGRVSDKIYDFTDIDELTLNNKYHYCVSGADLQTPFKEITVVPYEGALPHYWFDMMKIQPRTKKVTLNSFMDEFRIELTKWIDENWDANKFHFILHSSGWDSRIISAILRKLYEKRGKEDFGDFVFVCWGEEIPAFKKIMQLKGWEKNDYRVLPQFDDTFYSYFFNFKNAYKYLNGASTYPLNEIYWALDTLRHDEKIPERNDEIEFWFAYHFNLMFQELIGRKSNTVKEFLDKNYYDITTNYLSSMPCKVVAPIDGEGVVEHMIESDIEDGCGLRSRIAHILNPELENIPRIHVPTGQLIPPNYLTQIKRDYDRSWYGQNIQREAKTHNLINYNPFWLHWSIASLVEYYISRGVDVKQVGTS